MKAAVYQKTKSGACLVLQDVPDPVPGPGQVLVRIQATALNAADWRSMALGAIPKSRIFGADVAGIVAAVGPASQRFQPGDRVLGDLADCGFGGLAEYVAVPATALVRLPDQLDFVTAAALPMAAVTALQGLGLGLRPAPGTPTQPATPPAGALAGKRVLVWGASGGVGSFAVQLAREAGAWVAAVSGPANLEQSLALGAHQALDYTRQDPAASPERYDLILAVQGNTAPGRLRRLLNPGGRVVVVGGSIGRLLGTMLLGPFLSLGRRRVGVLAAKPHCPDLAHILDLVVAGRIKAVIDRQYPLDQAQAALDYLKSGHARGKVVLTINQNTI